MHKITVILNNEHLANSIPEPYTDLELELYSDFLEIHITEEIETMIRILNIEELFKNFEHVIL